MAIKKTTTTIQYPEFEHLFEGIEEEEVESEVKEQVKEHKFQVGDFVKVTKSATSNEDGWEDSWVEEMDEFVGKVWKVKNRYKHGVFSYNLSGWCFPEFVLEKVKTFQYEGSTWYYLTESDEFEPGDMVNATNSVYGWIENPSLTCSVAEWLSYRYTAARKVIV